MESTYGEYCKDHDAAIQKVQELSEKGDSRIKQFLKECQMELQGRTGAWDLGSLLIKPVQRVLKYPLLVKVRFVFNVQQLLKMTLPDHEDYKHLEKVLQDLEKTAENINELKKRKELVEKYVDGKGPHNVIHGLTKKINRTTQQVRRFSFVYEKIKIATGLTDESTVIHVF